MFSLKRGFHETDFLFWKNSREIDYKLLFISNMILRHCGCWRRRNGFQKCAVPSQLPQKWIPLFPFSFIHPFQFSDCGNSSIVITPSSWRQLLSASPWSYWIWHSTTSRYADLKLIWSYEFQMGCGYMHTVMPFICKACVCFF